MRNNNNLEQQFNEFNEQLGNYMFDELNVIALETCVNYIPLRNHVIAYQMLNDDKLYKELSDSEKFDWKSQFLSKEEEQHHIFLMSSEFQHKCYDWINSDDNTELSNEMTLTYGEELSTQLFDMFCLNIWKNYLGDCISVKIPQ
jgi:hypothetical protein